MGHGTSSNSTKKTLGKHDQLQDRSSDYAKAASPPSVETTPAANVTLALDVRRGLIGVSTAVAVVAIAGLTVVFQRGVELHTYTNTNMTQAERDDLLDTYNGYSGNVASALGRPLEMVIAMMTQLLVLRFLANALLQPEPKWHVAPVALGLSAVLGFLLNNGFNALNVQLRDLDADPVMQASDLAGPVAVTATNATATTSVAQSFAEAQANNSISNTLLHGLVLPRAPKAPSQCQASGIAQELIEDAVSYGVQPSDWMQHVLPEALAAKTLRVVINATDTTANNAITPADLPMNASRAADLFVIGAIVSTRYIPWGKNGEWRDDVSPEVFGNRANGDALPTAIAAGLLPPNAAASELEQRAFLLRSSQTFFNKRSLFTPNTSRVNIDVEFAHVDISPSITFDAMTWRVELNPDAMAAVRVNNGSSWYAKTWCGPHAGLCSLPRVERDPAVVVHAFAACANEDGTETLQSIPRSRTMYEFYIQCPRRSNSSLILLSATRHLVADTVLENTRANRTMLIPDDGEFTVVNPRKFYTFTVSRLGWTPLDVADKFAAKCGSATGCLGLDLETTDGKRLITGLANLPLDSLKLINFNYKTDNEALSPYRVVTVLEPPMPRLQTDYVYRDYLLPHNIGNRTGNTWRKDEKLCALEEDRQQLVLNNHMYMESTLQTTYTAGVFFLFQNAAVRDVVTRSDGQQTLAFDGNLPNVSLRIAIPTPNALLTGVGCVLLLAALLSAMIWPSSGGSVNAPDTMQAITTPHVIARVMLDDNAFPPSVVHRRVAHDTVVLEDKTAASLVDDFFIQSLTVARRNESHEMVAGRV